ncbi:hypothetical protein K505DRAFT_215529, partial [Melanomma pulvis-pyrius CBS 109.77]
RIEHQLWQFSTANGTITEWLLEIIGWLVSATCMAVVVGVLVILKDDAIPKLPLGLNLNTCISILSKVAFISLILPVSKALGLLEWSWLQDSNAKKKLWDFEIFDNASRGNWGSLLLILRTKGKLATAIGAAVALLTPAADFPFHQIVRYSERWRLQEGNGLIPVALGVPHQLFDYNGTVPFPHRNGGRTGIPLVCPNSKCTWPEYETLGVCTNCIDAVDLLEFRCINALLDGVRYPDEDDEGGRTYPEPEGTSCGWYLKVNTPVLVAGHNADGETAHAGEILEERAQPLSGFPSKLNSSRNPLAHAVLATRGSLSDIQRDATPKAWECIISWCVKTISSTCLEEIYTETVTKTVVNDTLGPSPWNTTAIYNNPGNLNDTRGTYMTENVTVRGDSGFAFHVDNYTHVLISSLFNNLLSSAYTLVNSTYPSDATVRSQKYIRVGPSMGNEPYNSFPYNNITTYLDILASVMTDMMRSSTTNTEMIKGVVYGKENFVDVRWGWLAPPLGLLGLIFLFRVTAVVRSSRRSTWKTSAMATLLDGLPDKTQKKIMTATDAGTPRAKAEEITINMLQTGW